MCFSYIRLSSLCDCDLVLYRSWTSTSSRETNIPRSAAELEAQQRQLKQDPTTSEPSTTSETIAPRPAESFIIDDTKKSIPLSFKKSADPTTPAPPQASKCLIDTGCSHPTYVEFDNDTNRKPISSLPTTPPVLPSREDPSKMKRISSDSHVASSNGSANSANEMNVLPLHYAELVHSRAPTSPTLKPDLMTQGSTTVVSSGVDYTPLDRIKTEALAKKKP